MELSEGSKQDLTPVEYCRQALQAIEVSEGRRKKRKRDTRPDTTGMSIKRDLLNQAIEDAPAADEFEGWLMEQVARSHAGGPVRAMAIEIFADYENARLFYNFSDWLADGAPTPKVGETGDRKPPG